jgi:hypothetical protein
MGAEVPTETGENAKVCRVQWDTDPVTVDAETDLAAPESPADRTERDEAKDFLQEILADGRVLAETVKGQARKAGIAERTLARAKRDLGVKAEKDGFDGPWYWSLAPKAAKDATPAIYGNRGSLGTLGGAEAPAEVVL